LTFFSCRVEINPGRSSVPLTGSSHGPGSESNPVCALKPGIETAEEFAAQCARHRGCAAGRSRGAV